MSQKSLIETIYADKPDLADRVREFIHAGVDLNGVTKYGESALRVASHNARFDIVELLLGAGADRSQLQWTPSFFEVVFGNLSSLKASILKHKDLEARDYWHRTPWLVAVHLGSIDKAALLLDLGADFTATGRGGRQAMAYAIERGHLVMLQWLVAQGLDIDAADDYHYTPLIIAAETGQTGCVQYLLDQGADISKENHISERAISVASNLEIVKLLVAAGEDINAINDEARAQLLGMATDTLPDASQADYAAGWQRRFGHKNPEKAENKFWLAMIRSGASAWRARELYSDTSRYDESPIWTYQRFGRTTTVLPDSRIVETGGEHEDYYDPDFCIYNDVTVFDGRGRIEHYIYPEKDFPPTDFHTATLVGGQIILIGNLGYPQARRAGETQVLSLDLDTWQVSTIATTDTPPGWIHRHRAKLDEDGSGIILTGGLIDRCNDTSLIDNSDDWRLDTRTWQWQRLTERQWLRFELSREDKKPNHLWALRQVLWSQQTGLNDDDEHIRQLQQELGELRLDILPALYRPEMAHEVLIDKQNECRIVIDGVIVRFQENNLTIQVTVEDAALGVGQIERLRDELQDKFAAIEQSPISWQWI